jgi:hypothetical protein
MLDFPVHTGYRVDATDWADVSALCERFGIPVPGESRHIEHAAMKLALWCSRHSLNPHPRPARRRLDDGPSASQTRVDNQPRLLGRRLS